MMAVLILAEVLQIIVPELLFTGGAVTIITIGFFFSLENPAYVFRRKLIIDALTGVELLRELYDRANGRIDIMAGCGVKKWNIQEIHDRAGLVVFHTTGRKDALDSGMRYRKQTVAMGLPSLSEYEIWQTDEEEFRACAEIVHSFAGAGA